jgi:Holliday junction resolvase RusA-like endonuclease
MIRFTVPGKPVAKGRPRLSTRGGFARAYTPAKTVAYEGLVAMAGQEAMAGAAPYTGPVAVSLTAVFPIPSSWPKKRRAEAHWHTGKPDGDNLAKSVGDGLNGVCWRDDSQVASWRVLKTYGETPGLHVEVTAL